MFAARLAVVAAFSASLLLSLGSSDARPRTHARTVKAWLVQYNEGEVSPDARYAVAYTDLNGDGRDEAVVYYQSPGGCGSGGCNLWVLASRNGLWQRVSGHTVTNLPIRVLPTRHRGWRDLSVWVQGGGELVGYHAALRFDGTTYPLNPTVPPARRLSPKSPGRVIIGRNTPLVPLRL